MRNFIGLTHAELLMQCMAVVSLVLARVRAVEPALWLERGI